MRLITKIGVLSALVFSASWLSVPIPTPLGPTRLHMGNVMCLLSGLLLGPVGGFAAGFGSFFYDLTNPAYIAESPITFLTKFAMAFLCGMIAYAGAANGEKASRNIIAAISGALCYVILYLAKTFIEGYFFSRLEIETVLITMVQKGGVSLINGIIASAVSVPLAVAVKKAMRR